MTSQLIISEELIKFFLPKINNILKAHKIQVLISEIILKNNEIHVRFKLPILPAMTIEIKNIRLEDNMIIFKLDGIVKPFIQLLMINPQIREIFSFNLSSDSSFNFDAFQQATFKNNIIQLQSLEVENGIKITFQ